MLKVAIVCGSKSDLGIVTKAADCLDRFSVPHCLRILSAHRTPLQTAQFAKSAREEGYGVIIAAAGKAAHLAGAIAAQTTLPVIAIPIKASALEGMDALLSSVQMPTGVPVATVAIDGAENAALLAVQILALSDSELHGKLEAYKNEIEEAALAADRELAGK